MGMYASSNGTGRTGREILIGLNMECKHEVEQKGGTRCYFRV